MKIYFISLVAVFALAGLALPEIVFGGHSIGTVTPACAEQAATDQTINASFEVSGATTPATSPIARFTKSGQNLSVSIGGAYDPDNPSPVPVRVTIPAAGVAIGKYAVEFCFGSPSHCAQRADAFEIALPGACPGGAGAGVGATPRERIPSNITTADQFIDLLDTLVDWLFVVVLVGSVIFIVLAGWQFISGGGEPQNVAQARNKLLYAAIGIVVAVLSRGIVAALRNLIGS